MERTRWLALGVALILVGLFWAYASSAPSGPSTPPAVPAGAVPKQLPANNTTTDAVSSIAVLVCGGSLASVV